jgi:hypothetical protein
MKNMKRPFLVKMILKRLKIIKIMIFIQYEKHEKAAGVVAVVSRP